MITAADPYPWPYDGILLPARTALVVAGAQVAWADRSVGAGVAAVIARVAIALRAVGGTVFLLRHGAVTTGQRRLGLPPLVGSGPWALAPTVETADVIVDVGGFDGFHASVLDDELRRRGIDHLVLCGHGAEVTVDGTLRSANDRGYECLTLVDAVAPFDADLGRHALASVTMSGGIFGAIAPSDALLDALSRIPSLTEV